MKKTRKIILTVLLCVLVAASIVYAFKPVISPQNDHYYPQLFAIGDTKDVTVRHKTELSYGDYNTETWIFKNNSARDKSFEIAYPTMCFQPFYINGEEQKLNFYYYTGDLIDQDIINGTYAEKMKTGYYLKEKDVTPEELGLDEKIVAYQFEFYPEDEELYEELRDKDPVANITIKYDPGKTRLFYDFGGYSTEINHKDNTLKVKMNIFYARSFETGGKALVFMTREDIGENAIHISPFALSDGKTFTGHVVRQEMTVKEALDLITEYRFSAIDEEFDAEKEIQSIKSAVYRSFVEFRDNGYISAEPENYGWSTDEPEEFSYVGIIYERVIGRGLPTNHRQFSLADVTVPAGEEVTVTVKCSFGFGKPVKYSKEGTRLNILPPPPSDLVYESYDFSIDLKDKPRQIFISQNMGLKKTGDGVRSASLDPYHDGYQITFSGNNYSPNSYYSDFNGYGY